MFNKAIARTDVPIYLSSDNDPLFTYHRRLANLRILEIDELKTVPYTPIFHPFVERLIGSLRRELLDQVFFWNTVDLERKLRSFQLYFNHSEHTRRWTETRLRKRAEVWSRIRPRCALSLGKSIAVAFSNSRSPREYEFATDTPAAGHQRID